MQRQTKVSISIPFSVRVFQAREEEVSRGGIPSSLSHGELRKTHAVLMCVNLKYFLFKSIVGSTVFIAIWGKSTCTYKGLHCVNGRTDHLGAEQFMNWFISDGSFFHRVINRGKRNQVDSPVERKFVAKRRRALPPGLHSSPLQDFSGRDPTVIYSLPESA